MKSAHLLSLVLAIVSFLSSPIEAADLHVVWTGAGDGKSWSDPKNWDPVLGMPPCNFDSVEFVVTIPPGKTVTFNLPGDCEIKSLEQGTPTGTEGTLNFNAGCNLTVTDQAGLYGRIYANNSTLTEYCSTAI